MTRYIDAYHARFGVEPICKVLQVAPSTYYAARRRLPSARWLRDEALKVRLKQVHAAHFGVYGARKLWRQLQREGIAVARRTVERLMHTLGLSGVVPGRHRRTTVPDEVTPRPADLVERHFRVPVPNRLWVADLTYVRTWSGFAYVAFHHRRLLTLHRRLAYLALAPYRPGAHRPGAGAVGAQGALRRACASLRSRRAVPLDPLHGAAGGSRDSNVSRQSGRLLRQRPRRVGNRASTKPNWSKGAAPGAAVKTSSWRRWSGWTGSTTGGCSARWATPRLQSTKHLGIL